MAKRLTVLPSVSAALSSTSQFCVTQTGWLKLTAAWLERPVTSSATNGPWMILILPSV
ncbi:hypothetical protein ACVWWG_006057 [Bradyrhizobium sp. LB7.2]